MYCGEYYLSSETKMKEVDSIRGHLVGVRICTAYYLDILKVRKHSGDLYVDEKLILKWLLQ